MPGRLPPAPEESTDFRGNHPVEGRTARSKGRAWKPGLEQRGHTGSGGRRGTGLVLGKREVRPLWGSFSGLGLPHLREPVETQAQPWGAGVRTAAPGAEVPWAPGVLGTRGVGPGLHQAERTDQALPPLAPGLPAPHPVVLPSGEVSGEAEEVLFLGGTCP